jgi:hypothetical protein
MKRFAILIGAVLVIALVAQASIASLHHHHGQRHHRDVLEFDTMAGVDGAFVGTANPIRGVPGGGLPWQIDRGRGELRADGSLRVRVEGLVLLDAAPVPPDLQGTNPVPMFKAVVSCLTSMGGNAVTKNVSTDTFPASTDGDARIRAKLMLPSPCFAPIVFVTSPTGAWFSVTGN